MTEPAAPRTRSPRTPWLRARWFRALRTRSISEAPGHSVPKAELELR